MENMENIINQIIGIEERAQNIVSDAQKTKASLKSDIEKETEEIRSDVKRKICEKYEAIAKVELEYADKKIKEISASYEAAEKKLDEIYKSKKEEWINGICDEILNIV